MKLYSLRLLVSLTAVQVTKLPNGAIIIVFLRSYILLKKGKVVYGQEPPSGESTTTECGLNYQLLAVITEVAQWGAPSCSQPDPATDNGVRDGRSN